MKKCTGCHERKPEDRFALKRKQNGTTYRRNRCRDCYNEDAKQNLERKDREADRKRSRYQDDPDYRRKLLSAQHKWKYGITTEEKEAMLAAQGGACAACGATESKGHGWATDHDHACCSGQRKSCGKCVRGILCTNCNLALGHAEDSIERLRALIRYLEAVKPATSAA